MLALFVGERANKIHSLLWQPNTIFPNDFAKTFFKCITPNMYIHSICVWTIKCGSTGELVGTCGKREQNQKSQLTPTKNATRTIQANCHDLSIRAISCLCSIPHTHTQRENTRVCDKVEFIFIFFFSSHRCRRRPRLGAH